ncbi:hypothetical protein BCR44DRAFT_1436334 [Catenaria anguillulae PL171]|uniref:AN1-type domain-containing protein n=1 Tax=Catenaria anguillulae PL171 TaxID=765915 RepID=A0A1Y2HIZ0_9FUNG|nr:hypothetical protein BCR44DRAFT_1436334 [Catenaria anguillulae PL171]
MGGAALCPAQSTDPDTSVTLGALGITDGVTLNATLTPTAAPTEAAAPAAVKKSKVRCNHPGGCKDKVNKLIGHCQFCDTLFCSRHRIPESHACESIDSCRKASFERNSDKLLGQKCVAQKV